MVTGLPRRTIPIASAARMTAKTMMTLRRTVFLPDVL
jgi:hypothetical protein